MEQLALDSPPSAVLPSAYDAIWSSLWIAWIVLLVAAIISLAKHYREYPRWWILALIIWFLPIIGPAMYLGHRFMVRRRRKS
ncbi:hypothetical protein [Corynebacterium pelargi]|uniref:Uncharacterized protein n=1 Tax=Corynebacterium pelargi TaxID=1471400 RepID=A0A410WAK5_9CORY|nr:hypothetical protein [Corynebacterium pelargi]QAU52991.1 hypothetical protein CPELA_08680 [Corynebacterium pelargi]GGG75578.1 hypothetical protein GCM10007338_11500 [Corynebacterium pelargi]